MEEISVKIYQVNGGDVRRFPFHVPKDPKASHQGIYGSLLEKVSQIILHGNSNLQLAWKDDENDLIVMNTDDEVKEALRHRQGEIFRIFIRLVDGLEMSKSETPVVENEPINVFIGTPPPQQEHPMEEQPADNVHRGIICDGCDQSGLQGVRFKCLVCRDFDLCATCEGKRVHDEHPMIRIPKPGDQKSWLPAFMASQGMSQFGFRGGRHGRCPYFGNRQNGDGAHQQPTVDEQQRQNEIPGGQFLREVGQAVAAVLNGFGIDVDIDVEQQDGLRTKVTPPKTEEQPQKTEEKKQEAATEVIAEQPMETAVASPPPTAETMETGVNTPEGHQDWMILEASDATVPQETPQAAAASATPTAPPASISPRIADALGYMMSMGFTNEGGWLTQLLEAKGGDIAAVLEILHPSDKP